MEEKVIKNKDNLIKALDEIKNEYDAYFINNKYASDFKETTHPKQFELLATLVGDKVNNALAWIKDCYDCYYKKDYENEKDTAFGYLRELINDLQK